MPDSSHDHPRGLIIRQQEPLNLEYPFDQLDGFLTPNASFYIRSHFKIPALDAQAYRLEITGAVKHPLSLSLSELTAFPLENQTATLECAGNSRVFLVPQTGGAQWSLGAVGTAEWSGIPLHTLLERAVLDPAACEVILEGADHGPAPASPKPPGKIPYARSISLQKALAPETLVALRMNACDLPLAHGFPARALVPGHFGMASVKWLTRIHVVTRTFHGYWQTSDYAFWEAGDHGLPVRRAITELQVKSAIARPALHETVSRGQPYTIYGAAWSGDAGVTHIEISTDKGEHWESGEFLDPPVRFAWRRWQYIWSTPLQPGPRTLLSRATDSSGHQQPATHNPNHASYLIHHTLPIEVFVR